MMVVAKSRGKQYYNELKKGISLDVHVRIVFIRESGLFCLVGYPVTQGWRALQADKAMMIVRLPVVVLSVSHSQLLLLLRFTAEAQDHLV